MQNFRMILLFYGHIRDIFVICVCVCVRDSQFYVEAGSPISLSVWKTGFCFLSPLLEIVMKSLLKVPEVGQMPTRQRWLQNSVFLSGLLLSLSFWTLSTHHFLISVSKHIASWFFRLYPEFVFVFSKKFSHNIWHMPFWKNKAGPSLT